ncbi:MAG: hypothetical protein V1867_03605 [Candidatus Falkowbacteria bacterium]
MMHDTLKETFYCLTGALVVFSGLEYLWSDLVLAYININWVLILWLVNGIVIVMIEPFNSHN